MARTYAARPIPVLPGDRITRARPTQLTPALRRHLLDSPPPSFIEVPMRRIRLAVVLTLSLVLAPLAGEAQQKAMPGIGVLNTGSPGPLSAPFMDAFRRGRSEAGYVEGQNLAIESRWAEGHYDRLPALAADLVGRKVDLIMASSPPSALAAKSATSTIPIIFRSGA